MDNELFRRLFRLALKIRLVEERIITLYPSDKIQSPVHLSIGQEGPAVALCDVLQPTDLLFGTYRSHAFYLAKGGDLAAMFCELYGRMGGDCHGKAGSMHLTAPSVGFMGASAIVASNVPHAVGAALAAKVRRTHQVCVAAFGDGATEEGVVHESLNFAALHQLPVLFFCENNGLAVHSPLSSRQSYDVCSWATAYGISVLRIDDSWDYVKARNLVGALIADVRTGRGPAFVEIKTYRYKEHVGPGDDFDAGYRSRDALKWWQDRDPLLTYPDLVAEMTPGILDEIEAAVACAEKADVPGRSQLLKDVV